MVYVKPMKNNEKIFVYCKVATGRNAMVVFCHFIINKNMTSNDALNLLKEKRQEIKKSLLHFAIVQQF
jgi:protein-tyrosine phosphatase